MLSPCPNCQRHVRVDDRACPFCAHVMPAPSAQPRRRIPRVGRALMMGGALALVGCGSGTPKPEPPDGNDVVNPDDGGNDDGSDDGDVTGDDDIGSPVALYGAAAPEPVDDVTPDDDGNAQTPERLSAPKYGAPPPPK